MDFKVNLIYWAIPFSLGLILADDGVYFVIHILCFTLRFETNIDPD